MISGECIYANVVRWHDIVIEHCAQVICGRYINIYEVIHRKYQICDEQLTIYNLKNITVLIKYFNIDVAYKPYYMT